MNTVWKKVQVLSYQLIYNCYTKLLTGFTLQSFRISNKFLMIANYFKLNFLLQN